ncbi:MAG: adenylate/guanylate cyclase domain-containing protein, partial [bacterium]|nr:adenylate/guanylate cyclase domain-containing protein [bacterium]
MKKENNIKARGNKKGRGRESLGSFVPKKIFSSEKHKAERFNAIVFCADISGFTNMSERLSALGKEGSEEITKVINLFFKPLVEIILSRRGDIFFFGGDAITALFRDSDGLSALFAAEEAVDYVKNHSIVSTSQGDFKISIHIALNRGKIFFYDSGRNYFLGGDVCYKVIDLLDEAEGGEIVLGKDLKEEVKEAKCVKIHEKAYKLKLLDLKRIPRKSKFICTETDKRISSYIPEWLRKQADAKQEFDQKDGEHRKASILFAHVREIPFDTENKESTEISKHLTKALLKNSEKYRGWINKIDFYKDGLRALVVFGYPEKLANDDEHAVLFAEELLSDLKNTKASVSIGVNSGSIFKTPVGSKDRMEITVMGDTVNTAARIAAKAEPGTVCAGAAVYENTKKRLKFKELESKKMKGKSKPVRIFQYESGKKTNEEEGVSEWLSESREMVGNRDVMSSLIK